VRLENRTIATRKKRGRRLDEFLRVDLSGAARKGLANGIQNVSDGFLRFAR
jgi:hypothetical protein